MLLIQRSCIVFRIRFKSSPNQKLVVFNWKWNGNPWSLEMTLVLNIVSIPVAINTETALSPKSWL